MQQGGSSAVHADQSSAIIGSSLVLGNLDEKVKCNRHIPQGICPKPEIDMRKRAAVHESGWERMLWWRRRRAATMAKSSTKRKRSPKSVLKLPDLEQSKTAVLNSLTSACSQRTYEHAIREFIDWYCSEPRLAFNKTVVTRYRIALEQRQYAPSTINLRLAAVRRLAYEAADCGLLSADLAAGIRRVKGARRLGVRIGNWPRRMRGSACLRRMGAPPHGN
jgi:hypothetical protein